MADNVDEATRSRIMSRVCAKNTKPEMVLRRALWAAGVRGYRCHVRSIPGTPDLSWPRRKIAVFVDSAWWHGHPSRWEPGRPPYQWDRTIAANRERDKRVNAELQARDWVVIRIWDFELQASIDAAVHRVIDVVAASTG
jgi:DNA mismatch endonuclease (patch repair protein)